MGTVVNAKLSEPHTVPDSECPPASQDLNSIGELAVGLASLKKLTRLEMWSRILAVRGTAILVWVPDPLWLVNDPSGLSEPKAFALLEVEGHWDPSGDPQGAASWGPGPSGNGLR